MIRAEDGISVPRRDDKSQSGDSGNGEEDVEITLTTLNDGGGIARQSNEEKEELCCPPATFSGSCD
jgi:hypothetical protein